MHWMKNETIPVECCNIPFNLEMSSSTQAYRQPMGLPLVRGELAGIYDATHNIA